MRQVAQHGSKMPMEQRPHLHTVQATTKATPVGPQSLYGLAQVIAMGLLLAHKFILC